MAGRDRPARDRRADLSQHFLREAPARRLILHTPIDPSDLVVEIGPGRGALTKWLWRKSQRLIGVELDPYLAERLPSHFGSKVEIVCGDFLDFALPDAACKVIGNIPFSRSAAILNKLTDAQRPPEEAWLLVQREFGERICGRPYCKESLQSLRLKPRWHVEIVDRVDRFDFDPPPAVDAVYLWMSRRAKPLIDPAAQGQFESLVGQVLQSGGPLRGSLRHHFSSLQSKRLAVDLRFDLDQRPSDLTFEQWLGLFRLLMY